MSLAFFTTSGERIEPVGMISMPANGYDVEEYFLPGHLELQIRGGAVHVHDGKNPFYVYIQQGPQYVDDGLSPQGKETIVYVEIRWPS